MTFFSLGARGEHVVACAAMASQAHPEWGRHQNPGNGDQMELLPRPARSCQTNPLYQSQP